MDLNVCNIDTHVYQDWNDSEDRTTQAWDSLKISHSTNSWKLFVLYFRVRTLQKKALSIQKRGHSGARYIMTYQNYNRKYIHTWNFCQGLNFEPPEKTTKNQTLGAKNAIFGVWKHPASLKSWDPPDRVSV